MIKLLASDIDGTIVYKDNKISSKNIEAIEKLNKTDIIFTICTGKTYLLMKELCKKINAKYGIFGNGTQIIDLKTGEELERNAIQKQEVEKCIDISNKNNLHVHIYTDNKIIAQDSLDYMAYRNYILYKGSINFEVVENLKQYIKEKKPSVLKLIISGEKDLSDIKQELSKDRNLTVTRIKKYNEYKDKIIEKEYEYLDIVPQNINKYSSLKRLCNYLNISKEEVMAIGDNINDIDMIENAKIGVAIGGCYEEIIKKASYVTKNSAKDGGFAEAINKFIKIEKGKVCIQ